VFDALFAAGRRRDGEYLQLVYAPARKPGGRVGLVVPRKALPLAVDRNRVRRLLRAAASSARPGIGRVDVILRLKRGCARAEFPAIAAEAARLLSDLARRTAAS
jgi:ribonuclease P protein component